MASAIPTSSLVLRDAAAQSGFTKSGLLGSFEKLPNELILHVLGFLKPEGLGVAACLNKQFQCFTQDSGLWNLKELKSRFRLLKNIFNKQVWAELIGPKTLELEGVNFEGEESFNPVSVSQALSDIHRLQVEGDAGYTVITMPQGLTINKLKSMIARLAAEGRFPSAAGQASLGFRFFWDCISEVLGDVPVDKSYTFAISNSVLMASRGQSYGVQRASINAADCELPQVLEAMTLFFLTYMASGERQERLCKADIEYTYVRCSEKVGTHLLVVGGFASAGLSVSHDFGGGNVGAGAVRKFF